MIVYCSIGDTSLREFYIMILILTITDDASVAYIDKVLENLQQAIADNGLDPADLPNGEEGFSKTIIGITFHGKAEVHDGFFQGTG